MVVGTGLVLIIWVLATACGGFGLEEPTPLTRAIADQDLARVERLLDEGADPNQRGVPLQTAAARETSRSSSSFSRAVPYSSEQ